MAGQWQFDAHSTATKSSPASSFNEELFTGCKKLRRRELGIILILSRRDTTQHPYPERAHRIFCQIPRPVPSWHSCLCFGIASSTERSPSYRPTADLACTLTRIVPASSETLRRQSTNGNAIDASSSLTPCSCAKHFSIFRFGNAKAIHEVYLFIRCFNFYRAI